MYGIIEYRNKQRRHNASAVCYSCYLKIVYHSGKYNLQNLDNIAAAWALVAVPPGCRELFSMPFISPFSTAQARGATAHPCTALISVKPVRLDLDVVLKPMYAAYLLNIAAIC